MRLLFVVSVVMAEDIKTSKSCSDSSQQAQQQVFETVFCYLLSAVFIFDGMTAYRSCR